MLVDAGVDVISDAGGLDKADCCAWRITNANVNISSSSPFSLSKKLGGPLGLDNGSGSYIVGQRQIQTWGFLRRLT